MILGALGSGGLAGLGAMQRAIALQQQEQRFQADEEQRAQDNAYRESMLRRAIAREGVEDQRWQQQWDRAGQWRDEDRTTSQQQALAGIAAQTGRIADPAALGPFAGALVGADGAVVQSPERRLATLQLDNYQTPSQQNTEWERRNEIEHRQRLEQIAASGRVQQAVAGVRNFGEAAPPAPGSWEEYADKLTRLRASLQGQLTNTLSQAATPQDRANLLQEIDDRAEDLLNVQYGVPRTSQTRQLIDRYYKAAKAGDQRGWAGLGQMWSRANANPLALRQFLALTAQYAPEWKPPAPAAGQ